MRVVVTGAASGIGTGDRITVTTVYPGYIRTRINERSTVAGVPLEGAVPAESVADATRAGEYAERIGRRKGKPQASRKGER
jgi:NAD(P)-dependent dehydrogenase (short-subunit alcohol dehydrogenase family)